MTADDPTMALIRSLDDPRKFVRKDHVAVFKPHVRKRNLPDGKTQEINVSDEDLPEIAARINAAYEEDGELVKLTVGHRNMTDEDFPEELQPPVVGYAKNYRAEVVDRPGGKKALRLTHTEYIDRRNPLAPKILANQWPERSPDYNTKSKTIRGVALLARDPHLSSGTVAYQADAVTYEGEAMADEMAMGQNSDWGPDDDAAYAKHCKYHAKYMAENPPDVGPATPVAADPLVAATTHAGEIQTYQADAVGSRVKAIEQQLAEERKARLDERKARVKAECERLLDPLKPARKFNYARELNTLVAYQSDDDRAAHVQYMLDNYEQLETDPGVGMVRIAPTQSSKGTPTAAVSAESILGTTDAGRAALARRRQQNAASTAAANLS